MWAMFAHLGGALGGFTSYIGIPGGNLVIPLIIWLIKKDNSPFVNDQGKEVLNFQICMLIVTIVCIATCVGIFLLLPIGIAALIFGIVGGVKANDGVTYRYPLNWRLIK